MFELTYLILCALYLFGGLITSMLSDDVIYFLYGYPIAILCLVLGMRQRKFRK